MSCARSDEDFCHDYLILSPAFGYFAPEVLSVQDMLVSECFGKFLRNELELSTLKKRGSYDTFVPYTVCVKDEQLFRKKKGQP